MPRSYSEAFIMAFKPETFTYQPLQDPMDFRLLKLLAGAQDENLDCSLTHSSLTSHPNYQAVSYTWGAPGLVREIKLDGAAHSIQKNLFDFLHQLRLTYAGVSLWVDAICINQNDTLEKNIQVPLMGLIYSHAKSVLIWLGPHADGSEEYFDSCNRISSESPSFTSYRLGLREKAEPDAQNHVPAAIASLQRRTYWTRTWIIQEIALASDIHVFCGDQSSHWFNFIHSMPEHDIGDQRIGMRNPTHTLGKLRNLCNIATRLTLRQLLFQCHMSRCSDPRDLIYGLVNVAMDTKDRPSSIVVDYSSSLENLFLQSMTCCSLSQTGYDGISCLQLCDTLSIRLEADLGRVIACAKEILKSRPMSELTNKLTSRSYFAKLTRFGRYTPQPPVVNENPQQNSVSSQTGNETQQLLTNYAIHELPGRTRLHHMWSFDIPEANDTIFILNFESPTISSQRLACICRPIHHDVDDYGVLPYGVVGLGVIPHQFKDDEEAEHKLDMQPTLELLRGDLRSLHGQVVSDSIPGYGLEVGLLELINLCMLARVTGSFVHWSIDEMTTAEHWQWS